MNNNVNLPKHVYAKLRTEFCNNLEPGTEGLIDCVIFAAEAIPNRALGFHVLRDDGALISQVPLHALCWFDGAPRWELPSLTPWDCFGWWLTAIEFEHLTGMPVDYLDPEGNPWYGEYLCTFDFLDNGFSGHPEQHKHLHFLKLDNGLFALQPNNRVRVHHKSFTEHLFNWENPPAIQTNRLAWSAERGPVTAPADA